MFLLGDLVIDITITLPQTNSSHLKMDGLKTKFPFRMATFQMHAVSFRKCIIVPSHYDYYCYDSYVTG